MALLFPQTEIVVINGRIAKPSNSGGVRRRRSLTVGRVGAPLRTADRETRVSETDSKEVYRYFSAPTPVRGDGSSIVPSLSASASSSSPPFLRQEKPSKKGGGDDEDRRDYYVNTGYAIRTLREEYPEIFYREPTFDIYRDDIVFKDPLNTFVGIDNYKTIFWALRINQRIFFKAIWVDIVSVWQPTENVIMIRWIVHGIPRVPWESHGRFDGTSEYKLDKNGKIYEHKVDNIALNSPPKFRVLAVEELILSLGCPSTPKPTYFEIMSAQAIACVPFLVRFTWVRYYLAFNLTIAWRSTAT